MQYRTETDSMGDVNVPADAYYMASTQRAVDNFPISNLRFSRRFIWALGLIKGSVATVAAERGAKDSEASDATRRAADEVMDGALDDQFVLDIFQTGSGTSTNTNANEVIAARASELLDGERGTHRVHPNDDVNYAQSSNDVIPTAIHLATVAAIREELLPALDTLAGDLAAKASEFADVVKSGRTHLMDATPVTLGQEFGGFASQIRHGQARLERVLPELEELALGGTATGTGINAPDGFAARVIELMAERTGMAFREADDHFEAQGAKDAAVAAAGVLNTIAVSYVKIANDIRFLGSGPRAGLGELALPENEPGSSIMPGKVNPTQCEALTQVCAHIMGNNAAIAFAGSQGHFELNVFNPMMAYNFLQSVRLLADAAISFTDNCVVGIEPRIDNIAKGVENSLMLVTALNERLGYDACAKIAKTAHKNGTTLREEAVGGGYLTDAEFTKLVRPEKMIGPK